MNKPKWTPIKIKLGDIIGWEHNPRMSNKAQAQRLIESEKRWGQPMAFAVSPLKDGKVFLYDGHQRYSSWLTVYGEDYEVDARQSDIFLTEEERLEFVVTMHVGATGSWDWQKLSSFPAPKLIEMGFDGDKLKDWNNNANNLKELLNSEKPEPVDAEPQIDRAAELQEKWNTASGQLWKLGEHRLLIGDSLDRENWVRLCGEERATLTWTDPPYGVNYGEKLDSTNPMGYRVRTIENDDLPPDQLEEFVRTALKNCAEFSVKGAAIYVACPAGTPLPAIIKAMAGSGYDYRWHLVWVKDQIVLSRADYHFKHENILYGWKPDGAHYFIDDRKQSSVFEYPRPKKSEEHPTMKPVELVEHMIKNSSREGDIVLEPFGGSGTTLLACQRQGRICRTTELSDKYGAVILERFEQATGIQPELVTE